MGNFDYDYVIIGSGFGGSVSALRLSEKGYKVLVIEKGKWFTKDDFPKTNWHLKKWLWVPFFKFFGLFKITVFRHVSILSGVGVGGGSLVYANTLPIPKATFFKSPSWQHLADWENELKNHYATALTMLGATQNPRLEIGDTVLQQLAKKYNKGDQFEKTTVAVYFGEKGKEVEDPYFDGKGPTRTGCIYCGGCMLGCRHNAKNTLDKNYLFLAQNLGAKIQAESEVVDVIKKEDGTGYQIKWKQSTTIVFKKSGTVSCRGVIFSGGVLGTIPLLLKLKKSSLPHLSERVGQGIRTNSESLIGITNIDKSHTFSDGIAIGSIFHTDEDCHVEPVRYPSGAGFWRILMSPMVAGKFWFTRLFKIVFEILSHPIQNFKMYFVDDWAKRTQILLFMQTINSQLRFKKGWFGMRSSIDQGDPPSAFIDESQEISKDYAKMVNGKPAVLLSETLMGIPTTAHILGGAVMGKDETEGVIDKDNRVFGYENMYVCDGSMISANPGVNPSLTITALTERAMQKIPPIIVV